MHYTLFVSTSGTTRIINIILCWTLGVMLLTKQSSEPGEGAGLRSRALWF